MPEYRVYLSLTVEVDAASHEHAMNIAHRMVNASKDRTDGYRVTGLNIDVNEKRESKED